MKLAVDPQTLAREAEARERQRDEAMVAALRAAPAGTRVYRAVSASEPQQG